MGQGKKFLTKPIYNMQVRAESQSTVCRCLLIITTARAMGLLPDTQNLGLRVRREYRGRFPTTAG